MCKLFAFFLSVRSYVFQFLNVFFIDFFRGLFRGRRFSKRMFTEQSYLARKEEENVVKKERADTNVELRVSYARTDL